MLCKCGCGGKTAIAKNTNRRFGHIAGLPFNFVVGHNRRKKQIEDYIIPEPNSGCHLWTGKLDQGGYGKKRHLGKDWYVHRLVYELENGAIPKDMTIDHLCRVRACVNTRHMEVVTRGENTLRGSGPAALNLRKKFCPKCFGPYTKKRNNTIRQCVNCRNTYERNRHAINKQKDELMNLHAEKGGVL